MLLEVSEVLILKNPEIWTKIFMNVPVITETFL